MPRFPKTAVPATRSSLPLLKVRRRLVLALLTFSILSGVVALVVAVALRPTAPVQAGADSRPAAIAEVAVRDFLAARNSTVPAAKDVNTRWAPDTLGSADPKDQVKPLDLKSLTLAEVRRQSLGDTGDQRVDLVKFMAVIGDAPFEITVPVVVDPTADSPRLGGEPSLVPAKLAKTETGDGADYENYKASENGGKLPAPVRDSISRWATTFAAEGSNSEALRAVTGDQDLHRTYSGLGGWKAEVTGVGNFVPVSEPATGDGVVVRVALALTSPAANGPTLNTAYDVYVLYTGSEAQPPVVAWGPAGSVVELTPYTYNANQS